MRNHLASAASLRTKQLLPIVSLGCGMSSPVGVQSPGPFIPTCCEETTIDQELAKEAAILTGIGMGTAFSLLVLLIIIIVLIRSFSARILGGQGVTQPPQPDPAARDKALAAAIAVTALLASPGRTASPGDG